MSEDETVGAVISRALEAREWSPADLAWVIGTPLRVVSAIMAGSRISPEMAKALGVALEVSPGLLLDIQAACGLRKAERPDDIVRTRAMLSAYPLRAMIERGWIEDSSDPVVLVERFCRFCDVDRLQDIPNFGASA